MKSIEQLKNITHEINQSITENRAIDSNRKTVNVTVKTVYGKDLIYPLNFNAHFFAKLARKKTFDETDLHLIAQLGFELVWLPYHEVKDLIN